MEKIAFIGLGHMGNPMANRLLKANYPLKVYDVSEKAMESFSDAKASSLREVLQKADVIFTMLQTGEQVKHVCLNKEGIFKLAKKNALLIDCSSIDIKITQELHAKAEKAGIQMIDAPVSGGELGAKNGSLTIMVGGKESNFKQALPILSALGKKIIHAGGNGHGQAAKICNNLILGISMIGVAEGFSLAEALGLNLKNFFDISSNASGQCWAMTSYCPYPGILPNVPSSHHYQPGFAAKMMLKDLKLASVAAETVNTDTPLGSVATELYELFVKLGNGDVDFSGIIQMFQHKE